MTDVPIKMLVCGGGNGAHTLTALASSRPNITVNVMTLFADEAQRWSDTLGSDSMLLDATHSDGRKEVMRGKPACVTKDPKVAMDGVDAVFIVVPAFAHKQYFEAISPYLKPNTTIVGMPGQAGFEIQALACLKELADNCTIINLESMPWACRIEAFAKSVKILGFKDALSVSVIGAKGTYKVPPVALVQRVLGAKPKLNPAQNYLAILLNCDSVVHPPIMYGQWHNWDGKPVTKAPLFYQGVDDVQAELLTKVADELLDVSAALKKFRPDLDMTEVTSLYEWYENHYQDQITDHSCLKRCMNTNAAYDGLVHPMKKVDGGLAPDFGYRYTTEDIPFGYCILKGVAECAGVKTPTIDMLIEWAQGIMGKEYVVGGKLVGKDVKDTRAPQAFGFTTLADLCKGI